VLTVLWTAYPPAMEAIGSTLAIPLFLAGLGIVVRGAAYALRSGAHSLREQTRIDAASAVSSILTPFALGAAIGGVASGRVPVGNAAGDLWSSWTNPTSLITGAIAVATSAYLAAVFLSADAVRLRQPDLAEAFRRRALGSGVVAGGLAAAGLIVLHDDARRIYDGLVSGDGLPALIVSGIAGIGTLALVVARRYEPARYSAALAVAAIIVGWALAQSPILLPGLTIHEAAAPHDALVAIVVAVIAGGLLVFPSLALLFRLTLVGTLRGGHGEQPTAATVAPPARALVDAATQGMLARAAIACLVVGFGFLSVLDAGWAHAIGVVALVAFVVLGFVAALPRSLLGET
jgi:cytochrome d ubiquinol oxidase subunit II